MYTLEKTSTRDTRQSIQATEHKASEWINDVTAGVWLPCAFGHAGSVKTKRNRGVEGARISASFIIHVRELRARAYISTYLFVISVRARHEFRFDACTRGNCRSRVRVSPPWDRFICAPCGKVEHPVHSCIGFGNIRWMKMLLWKPNAKM